MKVAFDASTLNKPWLSGMGVWMVQLYRALSKDIGPANGLELQPVARLSRMKYKKVMQSHLDESVRPYVPFVSDISYDLYHGPDFKLPSGLRIPKVVSIPDIAFYEAGMTAEAFANKKIQEVEHLLKKQNPDAVIVISEYTKAEVLKRFPEYESRIHVTLLGHEHLVTENRQAFQSPEAEPYILFVGNLEARKNVVRILQAFDQLCETNKHIPENLVMIGRAGYDFESIEATLGSLKHKDRVKMLGYVENNQLIAYYQNARAFVYPSLIEGFGIPLLEAMLNRCPIVTSNVTATAEVSGKAAVQVDPYSVEEISEGIASILKDSNVSDGLVSKGLERVKRFTWKSCAEETLKVYRELI